MTSKGRRLNLSPIGFDIILALSQTPDGLRLADLGNVIGSPNSSVQTALRVLIANGLVRRDRAEAPRYRVADDHPAQSALISAATVIADAPHAIGVILRANPAVAYAAVDGLGFLVGEAPNASPDAIATLDRQLDMIATARPDGPQVQRMPVDELERMLRVALELRARARRAVTIKGTPPVEARNVEEPRTRAV